MTETEHDVLTDIAYAIAQLRRGIASANPIFKNDAMERAVIALERAEVWTIRGVNHQEHRP